MSTTPAGAKLLRDYLNEQGLNIPEFCELHGLDRIQVQRVVKGDRAKRVSVNFAKSISDATEGKVPWDSWVTAPEGEEPDDSSEATTSVPTTPGH